MTISCDQIFESLITFPQLVECNCNPAIDLIDQLIVGTGAYNASSSICAAIYHSAVLVNTSVPGRTDPINVPYQAIILEDPGFAVPFVGSAGPGGLMSINGPPSAAYLPRDSCVVVAVDFVVLMLFY